MHAFSKSRTVWILANKSTQKAQVFGEHMQIKRIGSSHGKKKKSSQSVLYIFMLCLSSLKKVETIFN